MTFAWRMDADELRAGELRLLENAVASQTRVGFFADGLGQCLERDANPLLGGDLLLAADCSWRFELQDEGKQCRLDAVLRFPFTRMACA